MKTKRKIQIGADVLMSVVLLLTMSYSLTGKLLHELLGISMLVLMVVHHVLSFGFTKALFSDKRTPEKITKATLDILLLVCMLMLLSSSLVISEHVFKFLGISSFTSLARGFHMIGSYWLFALTGVHIGLHLGTMLRGMIKSEKARKITVLLLGVIAAAGLVLFIGEGLWSYMLYIRRFVFVDTEGGLALFLAKYIPIGIMYVFVGYLISLLFKKRR